MAIAAIAGLMTAGGAVAAAGGLTAFGLGTLFGGSLLTAFAIGAGLSIVSRALMPQAPSFGAQMQGNSVTVREPAASRKLVYGRARVGGAIVYLDSTGSNNQYLHLVIAVAGHAIDGFEEVWFNDTKIWDGSFQSNWGSYVHLGFHDGTQTTADSTLVAASSSWTADHKLLDTAYIYVRLNYSADQFAQGLPNISTVVRGKKVYNPVTSTTEWSQNPALCVFDYLKDTKYGLAESSTSVNSVALTAAQNLCDESINLSPSGTQSRYVLDGVLDTSNSRKDNIEAMLSSMAGKLIYSGGEYFIVGADYVAPTVTIDESVLVGGLSVKTKQSRRSLYNGVKGVYLAEEENYTLADYPSITSSAYSAEDGDPVYLDMPLPFTTNNVRAQRIAKMALLQSRQQTQITIPCNLSALKFKAGDNISVTNAKMGWSEKVFEVTGYQLDLSSDGTIAVNVDAIETASAIYDWATSDQQDFITGGEVDLYDGRTVAAPTSFAGAASTATNSDGTTVSQIVSTWSASADAFVIKYDYQWSTDNTNFNSINVEGTQFTISPTIGAATYYTRVRAVSELGVRSAFVTANVTAIGDTTAPALVTSASATGGQSSITLAWTNPADKDFSNAEIYRANTTGGTYTAIASVAGGHGLPSSFVNGSLSDSEDYFYKIKSVDYSGNKSAFSAIVSATTDAPASPPRADNGYVYYTQSSASAPSTPSATSYNYDTASFGGLTTNWQKNPPTINGADGKFWASSYTITEASFGGSQTITFSAPFASTQFDGLVTFTNLNTGLAASSTTIDGDKIKTGLIDANRIKIDDATIDTDASGNLIIKAGGVGSTQIGTLVVDDLTGDVNTTAVFSGSASKTFGPTSSGYRELMTADCLGNSTGKTHITNISMVFDAAFATDTAYVKLEYAVVTGGSAGSYTEIETMRHKTSAGGNSWTTLPVTGSVPTSTTSDIRFKVSIKMYADNGVSTTNQSRTGVAHWAGTTIGIV